MRFHVPGHGTGSLAARENLVWKLMILPTVLTLLIVTIFPTVFSLYNSLFQWNLSHPQYGRKFVGLGNYVRAVTDTLFLNSLLNTLKIVLIAVTAEFIIGLAIALLFNTKLRGLRVIRTVMIIPTMITSVVASLMWLLMYNSEFGILRFFAESVGIKPAPVWLADNNYALLSVITVDIWQWTPFVMLILLAGLTAIPRDVFEASHVDGANSFQRFFLITLPYLKPVASIAVLIRVMDTFKFFEIIYMLTKGGPGNATETVSYFAYKQSFSFFEIGYGTAVSTIVLVVITFISSLLVRYISDDWEI